VFVGLSALFYFAALGYHAFLSYSPVVKNQARTILIGTLLAFGPIVFWLLYASLRNVADPSSEAIPFNPYLFVPTVIFPLVNGYVILRPPPAHRLLAAPGWFIPC
jgi:hypothetical protein